MEKANPWQQLPARRTNKRGAVVEAEEWAAAIERFSNYLLGECVYDPAGLIHVKALISQLEQGRDIVLYHHSQLPAEKKMYAQRTLGAMLDVSHVAIGKAAKRGAILVGAAVPSLTGKRKFRARRAEELAARGIEDMRATGTDNVRAFRPRA